MNKINNGDRFGKLTVLEETTKEERKNPAGRNYWCQCDCGNKIIVYGHNLKTGNTKSCGCLNRESASERNTKDIVIGTRFGSLVVIERAPVRPGGSAYWKCKCDCGNVCEVKGSYLRGGQTTSCGCKKYPNRINEIGKQYGLLTVLRYAGSREKGGATWECQCRCGRLVTVRGEQLRRGKATSCGCISSYPELVIANLLDDNHIDYKRQYSFEDLRGLKNGLLRFDFAIFKQQHLYCLIEYQGGQHTDTSVAWHTEQLEIHDNLKKEYCKKHNILLYELTKKDDLSSFVKELKEVVNQWLPLESRL